MKSWSQWHVIRRQVAIGGRVVDKNNRPVSGAQVQLTSMPAGFKRQVEGAAGAVGAGWDDLAERQDRASSRSDGIYFFLDLPEGSYTLSAVDPKTGKQVIKSAAVSKDSEQNIEMARADFQLPD